MAFYDWLEGVSDSIDEKIDLAVSMCEEYGFLTALGCLIPNERAKRMLSILFILEWMNYEDDFDTEQDICADIDYIALSLYTERYNEIKYWWMPSK